MRKGRNVKQELSPYVTFSLKKNTFAAQDPEANRAPSPKRAGWPTEAAAPLKCPHLSAIVCPMPERADAIVVLGCRILPSGRPTTAALRRARRAAEAYLEGVAPHIVASGGRRWGPLIEADALRNEIIQQGVPEHDITRELWSLTTHENAIFSVEILRRLGASRVAIVTCAWHAERAKQNFQAAGIEAFALPSVATSAGPLRRIYRTGHELVCTWLDKRAIVERAHVLRDALPSSTRQARRSEP